MNFDQPPVVALAALRTRLYSLNEELTRLLRVALHPRSRVILTSARIDLSTAESRLNAQPDTIERENLVTWFDLIEARLRLVSRATMQFGADAVPSLSSDDGRAA